jgi:uncharacterized protein DUF7002
LTAESGERVSLTPARFIQYFPKLYHMAESGSWPSIRKHGLLSVTALLDLFEINGARRIRIERQRRPESVVIEHATHGRAVIRDQKPLSDSALLKCLEDMTPEEWYRTLNKRVFFWVSKERVATLLQARAYRGQPHCVAVVDTAELVRRYQDKITLCPINSGSTIFKPQPRGRNTFLPISNYPFQHWIDRRGGKNAVVELTVDYAVLDAYELVTQVDVFQGRRLLKKIYAK